MDSISNGKECSKGKKYTKEVKICDVPIFKPKQEKKKFNGKMQEVKKEWIDLVFSGRYSFAPQPF